MNNTIKDVQSQNFGRKSEMSKIERAILTPPVFHPFRILYERTVLCEMYESKLCDTYFMKINVLYRQIVTKMSKKCNWHISDSEIQSLVLFLDVLKNVTNGLYTMEIKLDYTGCMKTNCIIRKSYGKANCKLFPDIDRKRLKYSSFFTQ